jgi:hypothetical protein
MDIIVPLFGLEHHGRLAFLCQVVNDTTLTLRRTKRGYMKSFYMPPKRDAGETEALAGKSMPQPVKIIS